MGQANHRWKKAVIISKGDINIEEEDTARLPQTVGLSASWNFILINLAE